MMRPGTLATPGNGRKSSWSAPTGTTATRSGATPICSTMSRRDEDETVMIRGSRRATLFCMPTNPYQRRSDSSRQRVRAWARSTNLSTVTGWWQVPMTGQPSSIKPSSPVPKDWLSWTMSNSPRRRARSALTLKLKVKRLGKPAGHASCAISSRSTGERNSDSLGKRKGSGSR